MTSAHRRLAQQLTEKAKKATGLSTEPKGYQLNRYVPKGGMESTLHGSEIQKVYGAIRDFNEVMQKLAYLESYFSVENGYLPEHYGRIILNRQVKAIGHGKFKNTVAELTDLMNILEMYLRGLQESKAQDEERIMMTGESKYIENKQLYLGEDYAI